MPTETLHFENARFAQHLYNNDTRNLQALEDQQPCEREIHGLGTPRRVLRILATRLRGEPCSGAVAVLQDITELRRLVLVSGVLPRYSAFSLHRFVSVSFSLSTPSDDI